MMKLWPWRRAEKRQSLPYTDAIVNNVVAAAEGRRTGDAAAIAALEACASLYSFSLAAAELEGDEGVVKALGAPVRQLIGRELIRRGESVWMIELNPEQEIELIPVGFHHVRGEIRERDWLYWCSVYGPSGTMTKTLQSAGVCHFRYSTSTTIPWKGVPPLGWSSQTSALAGAIEQRLAEEASGPSGYFLTVPEDPGSDDDDSPTADLKADIAGARGKALVLETTAGGYGDREAAPRKDWEQTRFGAEPPDVLQLLRTDTAMSVCDAAGVPRSLIADSTGTAMREGWRRFIMGSVEPLARIIEAEIEKKMESVVKFNFRSAWAHDLQGRAASFRQMVAAGMSLDEAAKLSGVMADDS